MQCPDYKAEDSYVLKQIGDSFKSLLLNVLEEDSDNKKNAGLTDILSYNTEITERFLKVEKRLFLKKQAEQQGTEPDK